MKPLAPVIFASCPECKGKHVTLISDIPAAEELETATAGYVEDLRHMCAAHRKELTVSCWWPHGRPPDSECTRDPNAAPDIMRWRYENCWLANIRVRSRHYEIELYTYDDEPRKVLH